MRRLSSLLLPLALAGAACGDPIDPITTGGGTGATGFAVILTDDPANDPATALTRSGAGPLAIDGEIEGSVRVFLRNENDALIDLGADREVFLELQGSDSLTLRGLTRPATGRYVGIQLRFEGVSVLVRGGSEVGDTVLTQDAVLDVGNGGVATVEVATLPFDVVSEIDRDVVVDLNSERWITEANVDAGLVPQADLANNVTVEIP